MTTNPALTQQASRGRDDPVVTGLVTRARNGERQAWDALVNVCPVDLVHLPQVPAGGRRRRRRRPDRLAQARGPAGQDPRPEAALPGWLATSTRRECGRIARAARRPCDAGYALAAGTIPDDHVQPAEQDLLAAERHAALREAFGQLPPGCQQLLALLIHDPALSYAEISARLGIPVGSIGPSRRRCLDKLRRHPAVTALINADT